jgi:two-component system, OmpR family, sensor histidine kinase BaeS
VNLSLVHKVFATVLLTGAGLVWLVLELSTRTNVPLLGLAALAFSLLTASLLARHLRRPIRSLVEGTRKLGAGEYATRIPVESGDELAELAVSFNQLASALQRSEESRKQWVADVSHELRTPLSVLRAELEAIQDGVRQPDKAALDLLHGQVMALTSLTDDLFQLARSDVGQLQYRMQELDVWVLLKEGTERFLSRYQKKGLELDLVRESSRLRSSVWGDSDRLKQLIGNFLENSYRYTDAPGKVEVRCCSVGAQWIISFDDTAPGVPAELQQRLFERFYRVESSRSKQLGGAGLGLAICRNIAQAHGGELRAGPSRLGGLRLELTLPCYPR